MATPTHRPPGLPPRPKTPRTPQRNHPISFPNGNMTINIPSETDVVDPWPMRTPSPRMDIVIRTIDIPPPTNPEINTNEGTVLTTISSPTLDNNTRPPIPHRGSHESATSTSTNSNLVSSTPPSTPPTSTPRSRQRSPRESPRQRPSPRQRSSSFTYDTPRNNSERGRSRSANTSRRQRPRSTSHSRSDRTQQDQPRDVSPTPSDSATAPERRSRGRSRTTSHGGRGRDRSKTSERDHDAHPNTPKRNRSRSASLSRSLRTEGSFMEKLFGDHIDRAPCTNGPLAILPRTPLTTAVHYDSTHSLWIATLNLNQKAEAGGPERLSTRNLRAFSYPSEAEALESARCNAPPRMLPFSEFSSCFLCRGKFAVFRRPSHCRNCGICICLKCTTNWPAKMIPETFNIKNEKTVKVCKSCEWLSQSLKVALQKGKYDEAMAIYKTGNVNLRCPFASDKGESMFPVHCAVEGGSLKLLRWLVDEHFCPIRVVRSGTKLKTNNPLLTSKGRSPMNIAMTEGRISILRYLTVEKNMSVNEIKDLKIALLALDSVLKALPPEEDAKTEEKKQEEIVSMVTEFMVDDTEHNQLLAIDKEDPCEDDNTTATTVADACILCYEKSIDCVITPCGHQLCCMECSTNLTVCPVCNCEANFIRIYKP